MQDDFSYDQVPYPSFTFSQTHPDRLATMAAFHGVGSAPPEKCRVLELGCGDGTNLLWCATTLPESKFVGIDLSKPHIEEANLGASALGLNNISFFRQDLMEFNRDDYGEFDYIVAHGLFSWVPEFVRTKVLQIYSECLAPNGVGYISYNAFPGCHIRQMIGDMMKFHTDNCPDPVEKVRQSRALVRFISEAAEKDSIYQKIMKEEFEIFEYRHDSGIFHDDLSDVNTPFYFLEFIGKIRPHGLQFLCEAKASSKQALNLTPQSVEAFNSLGDDILRREQYLDFVLGRRFRSTLVCRADIEVDREGNPKILDHAFIGSKLTPVDVNVKIDSVESQRFETKDGTSIETNHPLTKAALLHLDKIGTDVISCEELIKEAVVLTGNTDKALLDGDINNAVGFLIEMYNAGFVDLHRRRPHFAKQAGEFPETSPFTRWQIRRKSNSLRTLLGANIKPEGNYVLDLLALLDGTRDRKALAAEMADLFEKNGEKREDFEDGLDESIDSVLAQLAAAGLLLK